MRRFRSISLVFLAIVASAPVAGCASKNRAIKLPGAIPATAAWVITVTLDQCQCEHCRVVVFDPSNNIDLFNRTDPTVGVEVAAASCYIQPTFGASLECGTCPGPGACTASATLRVGNGGPVEVTLVPIVSCTTAALAGATCQVPQQIFTIPATALTFNCVTL